MCKYCNGQRGTCMMHQIKETIPSQICRKDINEMKQNKWTHQYLPYQTMITEYVGA